MANETQTFYHKEFGEIGVIVENDKFYLFDKEYLFKFEDEENKNK